MVHQKTVIHYLVSFQRMVDQNNLAILKFKNILISLFAILLLCGCSQSPCENHPNEEGLSELHKVLKKNPDNIKILFRLAEKHRRDNDYKNVYKYVSRIIEIDSLNSHAFMLRGEILEEQLHYCKNAEEYEVSFEDKLIFRLALENYRVAASFSSTKEKAEMRMKDIETVADFSETILDPPLEIIKFHSDCYSWIKPEIKSRNLVYFITENRYYFRPAKN